MWKVKDLFQRELRTTLGGRVDQLFDFKVQLMEREIAEGWRCFYAREIWFKDHLPPPLVNELGRRYACEWLLINLNNDYGRSGSNYRSAFLDAFSSSPERRAGYRNYLDVGDGFDQVADEVTQMFVDLHHRYPWEEISENEKQWLLEAEKWASHTQPLVRGYYGKEAPQRNESVALAHDTAYWRALYWDGFRVLGLGQDFSTPDWTMRLMAALGADFPYSKRLSSKSKLVFVAEASGKPAWAIVFCKGSFVHYPPSLLLLSPDSGKKWSDGDVLFEDVLPRDRGVNLYAARGMELFLLCTLPRYRRLIRFYQPFVDAAWLATAGT